MIGDELEVSAFFLFLCGFAGGRVAGSNAKSPSRRLPCEASNVQRQRVPIHVTIVLASLCIFTQEPQAAVSFAYIGMQEYVLDYCTTTVVRTMLYSHHNRMSSRHPNPHVDGSSTT